MPTPLGKLTLLQAAVELCTVPARGAQENVASGALWDVMVNVTTVPSAIFWAAILTVTGEEALMVTSGTVKLPVGYWGALTPSTAVMRTEGLPVGSGGL